MRLVCPNCGAQYEVDDRVIPDGGRDVQCSSCGHAWYQMPAHLAADEEPVPAEPDETEAPETDEDPGHEPEPESEPEPEPERELVADAEQAPEESLPLPETPDDAASQALNEKVSAALDVALGGPAETSGDATLTEDTAQTTPDAAPEDVAPDAEVDEAGENKNDISLPAAIAGMAPPRRELDLNLRAILQEEVAREMEARAADDEPQPAEPTPGFVPAPSPTPSPTGPDAESSTAGLAETHEPDTDALAAAQAQAPRRELFPDIEEINSTLDSHVPADEVSHDDLSEKRGGFGRGFFAVIFIAALALAIYLVAPRLAETIPALEPALTAYVGAVNGARTALEGLMQGMTDSIDSSQ